MSDTQQGPVFEVLLDHHLDPARVNNTVSQGRKRTHVASVATSTLLVASSRTERCFSRNLAAQEDRLTQDS